MTTPISQSSFLMLSTFLFVYTEQRPHDFYPLLSSFPFNYEFKLTTMSVPPRPIYEHFLSTSTPFRPNATPSLINITVDRTRLHQDFEHPHPYPPPILSKRLQWYLPNANRFISIRGILYGLHRDMFPFGSYFLNIPPPEIQEGELIPRGFIPTLPLPLDDITYI
jgi:hypothetical protein